MLYESIKVYFEKPNFSIKTEKLIVFKFVKLILRNYLIIAIDYEAFTPPLAVGNSMSSPSLVCHSCGVNSPIPLAG